MKKIIIINGSGRCGKDTFVEYVKKVSNDRVYLISTVDKVKEIAKTMGWDGNKDEKSRKFLSDIKLAWTNYNNGVFQDTVASVSNIENMDDMVGLSLAFTVATPPARDHTSAP